MVRITIARVKNKQNPCQKIKVVNKKSTLLQECLFNPQQVLTSTNYRLLIGYYKGTDFPSLII